MAKRTLMGAGVALLAASLGPWAVAGATTHPDRAATASVVPPGILAPIGPGDAALDFTLDDAGGMSHMLENYRGKLVLLWFLGYG